MQRDRIIDIAKGLTIICVVLGHIRGDFLPVHSRFVGQFHVPLFFIVSGMLLNEKEGWCLFLKKKIKRLYVPYVIANFILLIINRMMELVKWGNVDFRQTVISSLNILIFQADVPSGGPSWFLFILFVSLILYKAIADCIRMVTKSSRWCTIIMTLVMLIIGTVGVENRLPVGLDRALIACFLIFSGKMFYQYAYPKFKEIDKIGLYFLLLCSSFAALCVLSSRNYISMYKCEYGYIPLSIIGVILGGLMIFSASCILNKINNLAAFCAYAGRKSIWILLCHLMLNRLLAQFVSFINISLGINIQYWNQPFDIVFLLFGVFGSLFISQMWEKVCNPGKFKSIKS